MTLPLPSPRSLLVLTALALSPVATAGGLSLQAETGWDLPVEGSGPSGLNVGGFAGMTVGLGIAQLTPEVGASFYLDDRAVLPKLGARLTTGVVLQPGLYGHILANTRDHWRPGWDLGGSLDLALIPTLRLGAHAGAISLARRDVSVQTGLHVGLRF